MAEPSSSAPGGRRARIPVVLSWLLPTPEALDTSCFNRLMIFRMPSKCSHTSCKQIVSTVKVADDQLKHHKFCKILNSASVHSLLVYSQLTTGK